MTLVLKNKQMNPYIRNRIIESNRSVAMLENSGFTCQGITKNLKQVGVLNPYGRMLFFDSYIDAAKSIFN